MSTARKTREASEAVRRATHQAHLEKVALKRAKAALLEEPSLLDQIPPESRPGAITRRNSVSRVL